MSPNIDFFWENIKFSRIEDVGVIINDKRKSSAELYIAIFRPNCALTQSLNLRFYGLFGKRILKIYEWGKWKMRIA